MTRSTKDIFINQRKFTLNLFREAVLLACKSASTPIDVNHKLALSTTHALSDPRYYKHLTGQLIYLLVTRPDLSFVVYTLTQFMVYPIEEQLSVAH